MIIVRTEWTNIARTAVGQAVSDQLTFPLETLSSFRARASCHRAKMRSVFEMYVGMSAKCQLATSLRVFNI